MASLRVSWGGVASDGAYNVSQGGNQMEFRDGGASMCASPCEFRWLPREVPKW